MINPQNLGENNQSQKYGINPNVKSLINRQNNSPTRAPQNVRNSSADNRTSSPNKQNTSKSPTGPRKKFIIGKKSVNPEERSSSNNQNYDQTPNLKDSDKKKANAEKIKAALNKSVPKGKTGDKRTSEWEDAIESEKKKKEMFGNKSSVVVPENKNGGNTRPNKIKNPIDKMISFPYDDNDSFVFESSDDEPKPVRNGNKQQEYSNIRNSGGSGNNRSGIEGNNTGNYSSAYGVLNPIEEESNITDSKTNLKNSSVPNQKLLKSNLQFDEITRSRPPVSPGYKNSHLLNSNDIYDSEFIKLEKTLYESKADSRAESNRMIQETSKRTQNFSNRNERTGTYNTNSRDNSISRADEGNRSVGNKSVGKSSKNGESGNRLAFVAGQNLISPNSVFIEKSN